MKAALEEKEEREVLAKLREKIRVTKLELLKLKKEQNSKALKNTLPKKIVALKLAGMSLALVGVVRNIKNVVCESK